MNASTTLLSVLGLLALTSGGRENTIPLTFALVGDVSVGRGVAQINAANWGAALSDVQAALKADATFGNLESPLTTQPHRGSGLDLRAPPAGVAALAAFTHLGVENNHALDGGVAGQTQTRTVLEKNGVTPVTRRLTVTRVRGVPVAWTAFFDDGHTLPPLAAIREGRRRAQIVVVGVHWGAEYGPVTAQQRWLAHALAAAGADLIVGSGPHVLQGHERIGNTLVLYSLGNLLLDQPYPDARVGAVVRVTRELAGWSACAVPTRYRAGRISPANGKERPRILARLGLDGCG
ncbi:CapA family protein [Deinococcus psychrotolerans]|uniref:CapA family protein n=1 Tax=Deinococcus psychrotolerans TaxID=2489213 RepID=UPI001F14C7E8|nr:CapA family protein [Deinococcus psychrotolerans]